VVAKKHEGTKSPRGPSQRIEIPEVTIGGKKVKGVIVHYDVGKPDNIRAESVTITDSKGRKFVPYYVFPQASEQRIRAVSKRATEVLGGEDEALRWLGSPIRALDFATPISLLGSDAGVQRVIDLLGQMECGIW
jgi:putative toxin-antitoxin system antitoxin component (TIGR02293 family)